MASSKAKLLEKNLEELHPFAARRVDASTQQKAPLSLPTAESMQSANQERSAEVRSVHQVAEPGISSSADRPIGSIPRRRRKRQTTHRAFEFYMDQLDSLEKFSLEERFEGDEGNKSQMVRQALDDYIAKRQGG